MNQYQEYFEGNRILWNKRTQVHKDSTFYDVPAFLLGKSSLNEIELKGLGEVKGKKILHLQCHFGMDSLSLARLGARVTGIDLSDASIEEARKLNSKLGLDAKFICCNVYEMKEHLQEKIRYRLYFVWSNWLATGLKEMGRNNISFFKAWWLFLYGRISSCGLDDG